MALARNLEPSALQGQIPPQEGARLVRMLLEFDVSIHGIKAGRPKPKSDGQLATAGKQRRL